MSKHEFLPDWISVPPPEKSFRSDFKWGAPHEFKHPNPRLYTFLKKTFDLTDADFQERRKTGEQTVECGIPIRLSTEDIDAFENIVGKDNISVDDYDRVKYATGKTTEETLKLRNGIVSHATDAVLHPRDKNDVQQIVAYCNDKKIPVYVFGGGSSVTLGLEHGKGGVTLVMGTYMNRILELMPPQNLLKK